jgi:UDP-N-acetylglucosamine:LPS N-acetylglucosamine transferase
LGTAHEHLAQNLGAADAVISAAGYNSYYEIASVGVPVLWLPQKRLTDDQFRRAQGEFPFSHQGAQRVATRPDALRSCLDTLLWSSAVAGQRPQGRGQVVDILQKHLQR